MPYSPMGAQSLGFAPWQPFGVYPWQAYVQPGDGHQSTPGMHRVAAPTATLGRVEPSATHSADWWGIQPWGLHRVTWSLHLLYMMGRSLLFQVWCHQMMQSILILLWVLNLVIPVWWLVIRVDEFTCTWSAEQFVAHSHIYPWFTGKVSSLTHFPLEPGCEDYAFLDQAVTDFEQGLDSILTDSLETPDLDTSLQESDAVTSSVSSGFLHSVSTVSDNSKLQLAPSIRTHKLWGQGRALLAPVSLATKMSTSKLIHYFSSHPAAFRFWASTPPDNIS